MPCLRWKRFNSFIEVSENGDIKSHGKIIKGEICKSGYKRVHVSDNGESFKFLVHRLVAIMFLPNVDDLPCVNHKDGNKLNNCVENLEWCTYSHNLKHAFETGLRDCNGEKNTQHKLNENDVIEIRDHYAKGKHGENSSYKLAKKYGVSPRTVLDIVNRKIWNHI